MSLSDAQRRANNKYYKRTYRALTCKLKKEKADAFEEICKSQDVTVNKAITNFVEAIISGEISVSSMSRDSSSTS